MGQVSQYWQWHLNCHGELWQQCTWHLKTDIITLTYQKINCSQEHNSQFYQWFCNPPCFFVCLFTSSEWSFCTQTRSLRRLTLVATRWKRSDFKWLSSQAPSASSPSQTWPLTEIESNRALSTNFRRFWDARYISSTFPSRSAISKMRACP